MMKTLTIVLTLGFLTILPSCDGADEERDDEVAYDVTVVRDGTDVALQSADLTEDSALSTPDDVVLHDDKGEVLSAYKLPMACYLCDECHVHTGGVVHCTGCTRIGC